MSTVAQCAPLAAAPAEAASEPSRALVFLLWAYVATLPLTGFMLLDIKSIAFGLSPNYLFSGLIMLLWFSWRERRGAMPAVVPASLYASLVFLSVLQSAAIPPGASDFADKRPWSFGFTQSLYVGWTLLFFLILANIFSCYPQLRRRVLRWHIITGCAACCWGIYQWVAFFFNWKYIAFFNNNPYRANLYEQTFMGLKRVNSTMLEPSEFGLYLLTIVPLLYLQTARDEQPVSNRFRIVALILCTTTLFLTTSLSAYFSFFVFLGIFLMTGKRWRSRRVVLGVAATLICFLLAGAVFNLAGGGLREAMLERLTSASDNPDYSTLERTNAALAALRMFAAHPAIGVGEGNFGFFYDQFTNDYNTNPLPRIYSFLPRVLAEHGLLGALLFGSFLYRIFRPKRFRPSARSVLYALLCFTMMASLIDTFIAMAEIDHFSMWLIAAVLATTAASTATVPLPIELHATVPAG